MKNAQCSWCQKAVDISSNQLLEGIPEAQYICSDCLLPLLPKTLTVPSEEYGGVEEKRTSQRLPLVSQIHVSQGAKKGHLTQALILDISDSGMRLKLVSEISESEKVTLGFLGTEVVYKAEGSVVRLKKNQIEAPDSYEIGVKLSGIQQYLRNN